MSIARPLAVTGVAAAFIAVPAAVADVQPASGMLRYPDVGAESIVFTYANDLWLVSRAGGTAAPLASPPGLELFPRFSPDGQTIAFVGNYDGNRDLYTIPVSGGVPARVTHHPSGEILCDWTPDGERLLFFSGGMDAQPRTTRLFTVPANGGLPEPLPLPYAANGAINAGGDWLAYTPYSRDTRTWKRYQGGMATDVWLFELNTHESRRITDWAGTDSLPMWHGDAVYYLSDGGPNHKLNLWRYDLENGQRRQITTFTEYDVKWPSMGPGPRGRGEIVFQNGSDLFLLDLGTMESTAVEVTIPGARPTVRDRRVDANDFSQWWHISATGKRAVVEARGDVWTLPAENGSPRNLTRTSGVAERQPSWSPDGRWIAYFSDESGEYELMVRQSDGKDEPRALTSGSATYYNDPIWSPDSTQIMYTDKAGSIYLTDVESAETTVVDTEPWGRLTRPSFSHDSRLIAYTRANPDRRNRSVRLYEIEPGTKTELTSGTFDDAEVTFDRKGDYLFFSSSRNFQPTYSDLDTTFVYRGSQVLLAVPLRADMTSPWLPETDEEAWGDDDDEEDSEEDGDDEEAEGDGDEEDADANGDDDAAPEDDGFSGVWEGTLRGADLPPGLEFVMNLTLSDDGAVSGTITVPMGNGSIEGTYDKETGDITGEITTDGGDTAAFTGRISDASMKITVSFEGQEVELTGTRTAAATDDEDDDNGNGSGKAREVVEVDAEGFEARAMLLPVGAGQFGFLAVNDKNQLLYSRFAQGSPPSIMLFDMDDEKKEEKTVAKGAGAFEISGDGKKLVISRGGNLAIQNASAGATGKNVVTAGMHVSINPREEWRQLLIEAWRLERDFFYVENLHGVDWPAVRYRYLQMLDDCVTREDVSFVIREMIAELNVGHAYYREGPDVEEVPEVPVGLLGIDWELANEAYRIARIHRGAPWDVDARGPLGAPGVDVNEGDYVLAVNGVPVDVDTDPFAAFIGTVGRPITLTVSVNPTIDDEAREVVVEPIGDESALRYRSWIERNRAFVDEQTDGQVGYIYVPNTGVNGQNDLVRQYVGQLDKKALIIDERWNGGGQIPTRFIEMLNRPVTNYWARRDSMDTPWPPDAHHGPKCMLINGRAGSGGDMFPFLFRQSGLGPLIGTRTWGGLVGISGNPGLIDGSSVTVPTFGFYETDGTWGIEGHGVEPDIEVIDDPSLLASGADPQLDRAIEEMLDAIERRPYVPPSRPAAPDRSGMGIQPSDK
ncbi:MAG: PD40 domain-containing protein [Phycisphaerae bacterium]|nr:PD40 domain-containing protein [Phycisphaerae bacterium]